MKKENELKKEIKQQSRTLLVLALVLLVAVTFGVSYAFFNYTRFGTTDNVINTGTVTFLYDEKEALGNGIMITNAYPMSDENGIVQTGNDNVFDFKILATTTGNADINYEITARKTTDSDDIDENIKLYLTEVEADREIAAPLTMTGTTIKKYSELGQTTTDVGDTVVEKTIYQNIISARTNNYEKNFRLRMWVSEDTDFSPVQDDEGNDNYPMNNRNFKVKVNVYANATVVSNGE